MHKYLQCLLALLLLMFCNSLHAESTRPNVLIFFIDDLLRCRHHGAELIAGHVGWIIRIGGLPGCATPGSTVVSTSPVSVGAE